MFVNIGKLSIILGLLLLMSLSVTVAYGYEDEEYQGNRDYGNLREHFRNFQAAQQEIRKKGNDVPVEPYSEAKIQQCLNDLKQDYNRVENWPSSNRKLGAISAVALNVYNNVVVFHRAERIWNGETFDQSTNIFLQENLGPIKDNTLIVFDKDNGNVISEWGRNMFYMPHGLSISGGDYYYVTDVALHQVFRFNIKNSTTKPELVLGEAFKPGKSANSFCKPTSTASLSNGDFFVADGYCNNRIVKFNFAGEKILEWGRSSFQGNAQVVSPPNSFAVPHALTLIPEKELVCVADRENGRIQCFHWSDGSYHSQYHNPIIGDRLFSVDYANNTLFLVNGPDYREKVIEIRGYTINMDSNNVTSKFGSFIDPHDIAVSSDAKEVYVADLTTDSNEHRLHKFLLNGLKPTTTSSGNIPVNLRNMRIVAGKMPMIRFHVHFSIHQNSVKSFTIEEMTKLSGTRFCSCLLFISPIRMLNHRETLEVSFLGQFSMYQGDISNASSNKVNVYKGQTALIVGSIVMIFMVFTVAAIVIMISRKNKRGNKIFRPWEKSTKNLFFDYNQFEKIPQNDDSSETQNEFA